MSWSSKKQPSVALSSTEGEYMAMTHASKEAIWIQQFLHDIRFLLSDPTTLLVDNQGAIALASNPTFHVQIKHIGHQETRRVLLELREQGEEQELGRF